MEGVENNVPKMVRNKFINHLLYHLKIWFETHTEAPFLVLKLVPNKFKKPNTTGRNGDEEKETKQISNQTIEIVSETKKISKMRQLQNKNKVKVKTEYSTVVSTVDVVTSSRVILPNLEDIEYNISRFDSLNENVLNLIQIKDRLMHLSVISYAEEEELITRLCNPAVIINDVPNINYKDLLCKSLEGIQLEKARTIDSECQTNLSYPCQTHQHDDDKESIIDRIKVDEIKKSLSDESSDLDNGSDMMDDESNYDADYG